MTATELIKELQKYVEVNGDLSVYMDTPYGFGGTEEIEVDGIEVYPEEKIKNNYNLSEKLTLPKRIRLS
ncbi:MAG TPA: hypothetical protein PLP33_27080 [Leptospiraceae bacterium]|nr:hypothetical protein [Leptospiraceae bacterium]